ncbi:type I restriction endonuclease subunit R [Actinopolyspora erythraea]|uniref:Restriction endonuclease subunit R n=1 Tax=Actinopolyspora erythraea TaxID=414996 RepID=A0A099D513_9ACTN|nr:type I restriction endonuclease [Actinopolyspora erythraea]ASU78946.1 type I restriction endonuclease subunit R [Actinopolyspora erythraea]KGI81283.1 restriction endonuclease subunit R [Actinopolyspora erythraea]
MNAPHGEAAFEAAIEQALLDSGWLKGSPETYRADLALDMTEVFTFLGETQPREWERLRAFYPDPDEAQRAFGKRLSEAIDQRGALDVLRHGVKDKSVLLRLAYFRPAHTVAEDALVEYRANRLTVVRQLHHSDKHPKDSLDLVLLLNGIPVATAELKNHLTGQTVEQAKHQYRHDRDPADTIFARRALVHFAVDPELVFVTTRLEGENTRFLPFNTGSEGPGVSGGGGNPPAEPGRYRTSYLWEKVWQPDNWLDLIRRFIHEQPDKSKQPNTRKSKTKQREVIFPRYHQWDAVLRMSEHVATHGPGNNYLVMHSAGSGKSNTIAWLAHRLSSLHTPGDEAGLDPEAVRAGLRPNQRVFDKIVVVTDRTVLDRQLQQTINQFDHVVGVVEPIDGKKGGSKSAHVSHALHDPGVKIVITTLQTFPYVLDQVANTGQQRFALIVDEAHSSQSGDSSKDLKRVLLKLGSDDVDEDGDPLTASALARGRHPNMSYFAFTATPKPKTLELFGTPNELGNYEPFHVYSMRQAIDEGFILDVLRNYVTYKTYYRLATEQANENKEVEARKAKAHLARFAELHPTSMRQRAELIVEHFREHTAKQLGGRAKAMVVTRSREHAVRLFLAIRDYVETRGYTEPDSLVAISGSISIDGAEYTESGLNGFGENELTGWFRYTRADDPNAAHSGQREYRLLVVADKYQTGFDEPLLTTMYVDKQLNGVAAVQTLSRLNRTHPLKSQDDIFVLDLANEAENIQAEFRKFHEHAVTPPTDPNLLYTAQHRVMHHALLVASEMRNFTEAYLSAQEQATTEAQWQRAHADLYRFTEPAKERFVHYQEREPEEAEEFRTALRDYVRMYAFLSQVIPYYDTDLEQLYLFGKHLLNVLPRGEDGSVDIGKIDLTHLRISKTGEHDVRVEPEGEQVLPGFSGGGSGAAAEPEKVTLAELLAEFNERHGTNLGEHDMLADVERVIADGHVQAAALNNSEETFADVFDSRFEDKVIERGEDNTKFLRKFLDDQEARDDYIRLARRRAYEMIHRDVA